MNCPYCNSDETFKVLFGKISEEMQDAIESGIAFCIHVSQIGKPVQVQENLFYCEDCKNTFIPKVRKTSTPITSFVIYYLPLIFSSHSFN